MNVPIDVSNVILTTTRLILRPWTMDDLDDFYEYARVDGVGQMAGWEPHSSIDKSKEILTHFIEENLCVAISHKSNWIFRH